MDVKKKIAKLYNKIYRLLQGSGLSKYQNVRKIHAFITQKVKSEFVDFYGLKLYLGKKDEENYSGGISYMMIILICWKPKLKKGKM